MFELKADTVVHDGAKQRAYAEGNAELDTAGAALHAERITWDHGSQFATAIGRVALRLTGGELMVVVADVVTVRFEDDEIQEIFISDGRVLGKKGISPAALRAITEPDALAHAGETTMAITGNHLVREGDQWRVESLDLVPCECNFDKPSWSIKGYDALIDNDSQRASMWGATVRVHGVPVFWLPWILLPLSDRQTGLLAPRPSSTTLNDFGIEQPVFITLGRSFDLTVTPGYYSGAFFPQADGGTAVPAEGAYGVKGPRLAAEFNYAPSPSTSGRITLGGIWDLKSQRDPANPLLNVPGQTRGLRGEGSWRHVQELGAGWHDRVDASFISDGYYNRDLTAEIFASAANYLRSTATAFHRGDDHWLGLDVGMRQDISSGYPIFGAAPNLPAWNVSKSGPNPLHRLPSVTWAVPERSLIGPLNFALLADYLRLSPTQGLSGDEGPAADEGRALPDETVGCQQLRLFTASLTPVPCAQFRAPAGKQFEGDRLWQLGEREARDRLQLMPRLSANFPISVITVSPYAAWRQGVWIGEASGTVTQRGYPLLGARVDSELYRFFGDVRHAIAPAIELRGIPFVTGSQPAPYDEVDTAIPSTQAQLQATAEIRQRLTRRGVDVLRLDLGQGVQLGGHSRGLGESWGRLAGAFGWFSGAVAARVDARLGELTRASATATVEDGAGHGGSLSYENLIDEGTDRSRKPIDLLFALPRALRSGVRAQAVSAGVHWRLGGFGLRYDLLILDRVFSAQVPAGVPTAIHLELAPVQHSVGVSYAPACDCFRLELSATQRPVLDAKQRLSFLVVPDFGATLTISHFGSFGVAR